jgi:hypothetical protein
VVATTIIVVAEVRKFLKRRATVSIEAPVIGPAVSGQPS